MTRLHRYFSSVLGFVFCVSGGVGLATGLSSIDAQADLKSYKSQKHKKRSKVRSEDCEQEYIRQRCNGDAAQCSTPPAQFCKERASRKKWKTLEVVGKGASLGAGAAAALIFDDSMAQTSSSGMPISEYAIIWNRVSAKAEPGFGYFQGGALGSTLDGTIRKSWYGVGFHHSYIFDSNDYISELDAGPNFSFGTAHFINSFQPSVLASWANDETSRLGAGLRARTTYVNGRVLVKFSPMLGYINDQWNYHLRTSLGYRITPSISLNAGYDFRDILDLNDLDISQSALSAVFASVGIRWN